MKTTIDKEFFEKWKNKDVVMWCKKEEYAEEFCKIMHKQGLKWCTSDSYLEKNRWHVHYELTVYLFNTGYFTELNLPEINNYTILDFEDYIVKEKMTKEELVKLMVDDFTDKYGKLDLSDLDFTKYDCKVDISGMKVSGTLVQNNQKADDIFQDKQEVKGSLFQDRQKVGENLYQNLQKVQGHLFQGSQIVQGSLYQNFQEVKKGLYQDKLKTEKDKDEETSQISNGLLIKEMLVKLLIENFANEYGELDISDLDFSEYNLDIDISGIKTRGDIYQSDHITKGSIYQLRNKVGGELYQEI